ncbi:DNA-processing protein DprA [Phnomibacter ginsenosidimutans]|uniref:DNA-protecting protein DprA n=1 Tax=Phnomibacter ginsenosidimutans TaxID=2676868 RepID=A0A6I6GC15_9BACT|nr:DNA-processing protein DprA [Phnomibacter ginsenosidimutans]QGW29273.1 DNA-protecting protein DprA [Phnomibacter ginsenosidimutans]
MPTELEYRIALTQVPQIGCVAAKTLLQHFGNATDIFKAKKSMLSAIDGIGTVRAESIKQYTDFELCSSEVAFIEKHHIQPLCLLDEAYPKRLLNCYDSPTMLYYKGEANLNQSRIVSIIGTRKNSDYGKHCVQELMESLAAHEVLIVSGLAFGIDTLAHRDALKHKLPTVAVLAHGLQTIYPAENKKLAKQMLEEGGGILTEFMSGTGPDKHNFPTRNRIVAGMADATIVVETDVKGGSMITAELANNYNRDVLAYPGKITDSRSRGCNHLIKTNKAALITSGQDVLEMMNWLPQEKKAPAQRSLFIELSADERILYDLLQPSPLHIDEINLRSQLSASAVATALLTLELQGVVASLPGKMYKLL